MQAVMQTVPMFAFFLWSGKEMILVLALFWILFLAKNPDFPRQLGRLLFKDKPEEPHKPEEPRRFLDAEAYDAGESLGGIYGKPAAQAITPENEVAELYQPPALEPEKKGAGNPKAKRNVFQRLWLWLRSLLSRSQKQESGT